MTLNISVLEEKFISSYIEFVDKYVDSKNQYYILIKHKNYNYDSISKKLYSDKKVKVVLYEDEKDIFQVLEFMKKSKKIVLHGLWKDKINQLLYDNVYLLEKSYWIMWGGDFYSPQKQNHIKKSIIKNMAYLVTNTRGDYELAKKWYGARGKYIKCFNYPSNLYKEYNLKVETHKGINIQLGNSSDPSNNHFEILEKLVKYKDNDIKIFVPLSYGDKEYSKKVIERGKLYFNQKFVPLLDFLPFEEYLTFQMSIDIAIFNHNRQQAAGNIISLLGMGKKVYLNKESTLNRVFEECNIYKYNTENISLEFLSKDKQIHNIYSIKKFFSKEVLIKTLRSWII